MKISSLKKVCLAMLPLLLGGTLSAQKIVQIESPNFAMPDDETNPARADVVIFSNLGPSASDKYDSRIFAAFPVAGKSVIGVPETWVAVNFIPKKFKRVCCWPQLTTSREPSLLTLASMAIRMAKWELHFPAGRAAQPRFLQMVSVVS